MCTWTHDHVSAAKELQNMWKEHNFNGQNFAFSACHSLETINFICIFVHVFVLVHMLHHLATFPHVRSY